MRFLKSLLILFVPVMFAACSGNGSDSASASSDDSSSSACEDYDISSSSAKSSSSISPKSSSSYEIKVWRASKESFLNPNVVYDTIVDERDGQVYKIVKIDDQWWMAENLNYKSERSWCYGGLEENCNVAGRLYTWASAMDSVGEFGENGKGCGFGTRCGYKYPVRGVCPEGWFLPSLGDWNTLIAFVSSYCETGWCWYYISGKFLKSQVGWAHDGNGMDNAGFSAIPAGYKVNGGEGFDDADSVAIFWGAGENGESWSSSVRLLSRTDTAYTSSMTMKNYGYSVRCFKPLDVQASPCKTDSSDTCEYGTLTDERDGQIYRTVKVGDQWWMAENLNYAYSESDDGLDSLSYCYESRPQNCDVYGHLYTWSAAMDSAAVFGENGKGCGKDSICSPIMPVRGICPKGWHLPDTSDWGKLFTAIGGKPKAGTLLKTDTSWSSWGGGNDAYGFSVNSVRFGRKSDFNGNYGFAGCWARFWTSRQDLYTSSGNALYYEFEYDKDKVSLLLRGKSDGLSVRCVKD